MLLNLFTSSNPKMAFVSLLLSLPVILLSLTMHECAHGYMAYRCGDSTAKAFGRLTLNPLKHLDIAGTLCMLIAGFGWAKPVPVNTRNLRNPKRDMVLVSLAGPVSNLLLAFVAAAVAELLRAIARANGLFSIFGNFLWYEGNLGLALYFIYELFNLMVILNIGLALFNLIPLPPLDGSKILAGLLPGHLAVRYLQIERYSSQIFLVVMLLSITGKLSILLYPLQWARTAIGNGFFELFEFLFKGIG